MMNPAAIRKLEAMAARTLVLWDVDHTLMETGGIGAELFGAAFEQATGQPLVDAAPVTGRTEPAIFRESAERQSVPWSEELFDRYAAMLALGYQQRAAEMARRGRALPGAPEAIEALTKTGMTVQSIVTGNLRPVTEVKLATFGLDAGLDLDVGAFGSDDVLRAHLVQIARQRAGRKYRTRFGPMATVIIGDTPADVQAGFDGGARVVAVATGRNTAGELQHAGARIVLPDLRDSNSVVRAVLGPGSEASAGE
jgi:phosphoglycolate phosphatase